MLTNSEWTIDAPELCAAFSFAKVHILNDFEATALSLALLTAADLYPVGGGEAVLGAPMAVLQERLAIQSPRQCDPLAQSSRRQLLPNAGMALAAYLGVEEHQRPELRNGFREFCGSPNALFKCGSSRTSQSRFMVSRLVRD